VPSPNAKGIALGQAPLGMGSTACQEDCPKHTSTNNDLFSSSKDP